MFKAFLFGLSIGSVGTLLSMQYHLVRTSERFVVVSRAHQPPLRSAYVDIRSWNASTWQRYPELQEAMTKAGREDLMIERPKAESLVEQSQTATSAKIVSTNTSEPTPIFTASDARQTMPASKELNINGQQLSTIPQQQPSADSSSTGSLPITGGLGSEFSQKDHAPPTMQKLVPNPVDVESQRREKAANPPVATNSQPHPKGDWVQHLIQSMVPSGSASAPQQNQTSAEAATSSDAQPISYPSPRIIPQSQDDSFPSSPRRVPVANSQLN